MNGKQIITTLDLVLHWIMRFTIVNLLWIFFSILGVIVGGVFPATVAAMAVCRKWLLGESEIRIWKTFYQCYRKDFLKVNILGWSLTLVGSLLYVNYQLIADMNGKLLVIVPFAFYFLVFFYLLIVLWSFPLFVHYQTSILHHIRNAIIIGLTKLHYTLVLLLIVGSVFYASLDFPGIIPFFSFSLLTFGCMWASMQLFIKLDRKNV